MGQVTHVAQQLGEVRKREFRRMLVFSLIAHAAMVSISMIERPSQVVSLPGVVSVELVSLPGAPPAPKPAAKPAPAEPEPIPEPEPPPPPKPVAKKVVLPDKPSTPKAKPKPKKVVKKTPPPPAQENYEDVMAQLREDAGESAPTPPPPVRRAAPPATGSAGGFGVVVSPEVAAWLKKAKIHVRRAWVLPAAFRTQQLEAHVLVELDAGGNVVGVPKVVKRSGNPWFDDGVVRAIQSSSPLPPPPTADEWAFVFVPGDSY